MVDKLGLNFGSSATSARTSRDLTSNVSAGSDGAAGQRSSDDTAIGVNAETCADHGRYRAAGLAHDTPALHVHAPRGHRGDLTAAMLTGPGSWDDNSTVAACGQRDAVPTTRFGGVRVVVVGH